MKLALWLAAAALPLAAQPKLLVNAQVDTRSAASGLQPLFRTLTAAQPQPAWIGYTVPLLPGTRLGCELVSPNGSWAPGVVHLEAPREMVVLVRIEANAVERVRTLSPDCEIDAGGAPVHWLTDVTGAGSVALLGATAGDPGRAGSAAVSAIALHADPSSVDLLVSLARGDANPRVRSQAVSALARRPSPKAVDAIVAAIQGDADLQVRRRGVSALQSLPGAAGIPLLIQTVQTSRDADVRKQAMSCLSQSRDPRALRFFEDLLTK